ncbi:MAG: peptidylprolyl isomerase [Acetobacteraceae bacterium]
MTSHCLPFRPLSLLAAGWITASGAALAQTAPKPGSSPLAPGDLSKPAFDTATPVYGSGQKARDGGGTVVADVDGKAITLGDIGEAIRGLPPSVAALPFQTLFPSVLSQLIRREALVIRARRLGIDENPDVRRKMRIASDQVLADALLNTEVAKTISEDALLDRYRRDYAGKPGEDAVRVGVIMVPTEAQATTIIAELARGADFAMVAKRDSKDSTAPAGGDLGFVTRSGLTPEIGAVAFALPVGQVSAYPVRSGGAWFVVKATERHAQPTPAYATVRGQIMKDLLREAVPEVVQQTLADVAVREYAISGQEIVPDKPAGE